MDLSGSKGPSIYEFLAEADLTEYYSAIKTRLKVQNTSHLKYVTDEDLLQIGMSKPEMRRLKKFFNKYYPQNYLSKFKKMLLSKKDEQGTSYLVPNALDSPEGRQDDRGPRVPNKHIISAENIVVNKELGMGEFGVVQQGVWTNDGYRIQVAIKCLSRERMQSNPNEFLKEAAIMHSIDHEHVVRLYGVVLHTDSLMLVTELAPLRSLLECLKEPSLRASFPVLTLCDFALQICDGMQYLEAKRLIHRDLAARNILVFSKNKVKISDFGLSRALGQGKDYYQTNFNVHLKLPIAWCAPECISYLRFTSASDVWAYGVTLWEMFSYGFQPWAALTGHQILEAIDEPNYQRLDQPECCPKEYFTVMLRCWAHEPSNRPTFAELMTTLPECRPEQVQAVINTPPEFSNINTDTNSAMKREYLQFRISDVITVLDKEVNSQMWKGILANGKSGLFNPAHTVAYIGTNLPNSNKPETFSRSESRYSSTRRKLRTEMISSPQGDLKHTSHIGLDGAFFGDISFFRGNDNGEEKNSSASQLPRQIVTPFRPHEDMDQTPLLGSSASSNVFLTPNTPPPSSHSSLAPISLHASDHIALSVRQLQQMSGPCNEPISNRQLWNNHSQSDAQIDHEYHEISDEENLVAESPRFEKAFEYGPSLLEEIESVFRNSPNLSTPNSPLENITKYNENIANKYNEIRELSARLSSRTSKKQATVKPISAHDQKILDSAIELATEITARSLNDLDAEPVPVTPASPTKRKFSFRFPLSGGGHSAEVDAQKSERRNFSDEAQSIPELQSTLTEEAQLAYESLVETPSPETSPQYRRQLSNQSIDNPLRMLRSGNFPLIKPRTRTVNTLGTEHRVNHVSKRNKKGDLKSKTWHRCSDGKGKLAGDCTDGNGDDDDVFGRHKDVGEMRCKKPTSSVSDESNCGDNSHDLHGSKVNDNICVPPSYSEYQREENNPIPLPPRDRTKPQLVSKTRHQRMFPLNIPASSIQRTLNKINAISPDDAPHIDLSENLIRIIPDSEIPTKPSYVNYNPFNSKESRDEPDFDTQSLHFEAQIDSSLAALDQLNLGPDGAEFSESNHHHHSGEHESRNANTNNTKVKNVIHVIYNKKIENVPKTDPGEPLQQNNNGNNEDVQLRHSSDHVSLEDLLHFDGKPSSRARGIDSDEVRIMSKVLGPKISSQQCLLALEHSNWDVHKAIKLTKLQNLLKVSLSADNPFVDLSTCNEALETNQWDLKKAANWIVAANQNDDITLV